MLYRYVVLGCGKQGTAAAYDLARFGNASSILLADSNLDAAKSALQRIQKTIPKDSRKIKFQVEQLDAQDTTKLSRLLCGANGVLSALPYYLNPPAAKASIKMKVDYCDLGGYLDSTREILKMDKAAKQAGITLIPDCGLAPGMCTSLAVCGMEHLDIAKEVKIYCGGLPQTPRPPLGYKVVYNLEGLLGIYFGKAFVLRKGKVQQVSTFTEYEQIEFPHLGIVESFVTGGGTSTCPWTFEHQLQNYEYKTLRYPGHFEKMLLLKDLGFLEDKPIQVNGGKVVPRKLFMELVGPRLAFPEDRDLVALRVQIRGTKNTHPTELTYDVLDYHDEQTGFSAMERTTGFSAAIVLSMVVHERIKPAGALPVEKCVPGRAFVEEIRKRGIKIQETIRNTASAVRRDS